MGDDGAMTIARRIKLSNLFMILIPISVALVVGGASVGIGYAVLTKSGGTGFDQETFYQSREALTKEVDECFSHADPKKELASFCAPLDPNQVRLSIQDPSGSYFEFGAAQAVDATLLSQATDGAFISLSGRELYYTVYTSANVDYRIAFYCNDTALSYHNLKVLLIVAASIFLFAVILSIVLCDLFLSRSLFRRIEKPLNLLLEGAKQNEKGNFGYRIPYDGDDEFSPIIAEYNAMSEKTAASIQSLKDDERSREILVSGLAHDIKSPLTAIQGSAEGILDGVAATPLLKKKYLETIRDKAIEIDGLLGQMSAVTSPKDHEMPLVSAASSIDQFMDENREFYLRSGLSLEKEGHLDFSLPMGERSFARVLSNLAGNSLKYKTAKEGHLVFELFAEGDRYGLRAYDDGPGVKEDELPLLFDAFYRGDASRSHPENGSGLGLAIVKKIVENAGGAVSAKKGPLGGLEIDTSFPKGAGQ